MNFAKSLMIFKSFSPLIRLHHSKYLMADEMSRNIAALQARTCSWRRFSFHPFHVCNLPSLIAVALEWRHNGRDGVSNHQPYDCLLNRLFRRRSNNTSKLRVTGLCAGNSPVTAEFPAQMASNAENVSIWWRHHGLFNWIISKYSIATISLQYNKDENTNSYTDYTMYSLAASKWVIKRL